MMIMVRIHIEFLKWYVNILALAHINLFNYYNYLYPQSKSFKKGYAEVYRTLFNDLLQLHCLKWNFNRFDRI
jgi:hypothetical protein